MDTLLTKRTGDQPLLADPGCFDYTPPDTHRVIPARIITPVGLPTTFAVALPPIAKHQAAARHGAFGLLQVR